MNRGIIAAAAFCVAVFAAGFGRQEHGGHAAHHAGDAARDTAKQAEEQSLIDHELSDLREKIAGREKQPAGEVFRNIQLFKTMEAGKLPGTMGFWSHALGVTCKHCHIVDQWEKEDRPEKQIARDMVGMVSEINTNLLKNIKNLDSPEPKIGCWTCHRGKVIPEFFPPREKKN